MDAFSQRTGRFIEALRQLEETRDVERFEKLFAEDAQLSKLAHAEPYAGADGVRQFWDEYTASFDEIRSEFHSVIETGDSAVLEWTAEGRLPGGKELHYRGVSVLEWRDDHVHRFRTYYDSAAFLVNRLQGHR